MSDGGLRVGPRGHRSSAATDQRVSCKVLEQKLVEFGVREARLGGVEGVAVVAVTDAFEHDQVGDRAGAPKKNSLVLPMGTCQNMSISSRQPVPGSRPAGDARKYAGGAARAGSPCAGTSFETRSSPSDSSRPVGRSPLLDGDLADRSVLADPGWTAG